MNQQAVNELPSYYSSLSEEGKNKIAKDILTDSADPRNMGTIINPTTNQSIDLKNLVATVGETEALIVIRKILDNLGENGTSAKSYTSDELDELVNRHKKGETLTKSETAIVESLLDKKQNDIKTQAETQEVIFDLYLNMLATVQRDYNFKPTLADFITPFSLLSTVSVVHDKTSPMGIFESLGPEAIYEMYNQVAEDIYIAWSKKCNVPLSNDMMVMSLLTLASRLAFDEPRELISHDKIAKIIGYDECDCDDCENCDCPEHTK